MKTVVLREAGYEEALLGMALSYYDHAIPLEIWWNEEKIERAKKRALALAFRGGGHNKFLESMQVWLFVQASRDFWSEMDTYRVGISKQSSSTMHTLSKRYATKEDFESGTNPLCIEAFNKVLSLKPCVTTLKKNLPEGFLQTRIISTNYKVLQNIAFQRKGHRLKQWNSFLKMLQKQLEHPEFIWQD